MLRLRRRTPSRPPSRASCRPSGGRRRTSSYVTLVGGDDILPMGRIPDLTRVANESDYARHVRRRGQPAIGRPGRRLPADRRRLRRHEPDGDRQRQQPVRPAARGRPTRGDAGRDPVAAPGLHRQGGRHARHRHRHGRGYDFLADGAAIVRDRLTTGGRMVDGDADRSTAAPPTPWTSADLLAKLFPAAAASPGIATVNAHYDHTALLPSAGNTGVDGDLLTAAEVLDASAVDKPPQPAPVHDGLPRRPRGPGRIRAREPAPISTPCGSTGRRRCQRPRSPSTSPTPGSGSATRRRWPTRSA